MGRLSRDKRDVFYRLAKEKGYRARSAFKLLQIDAEFHIFENVTRAVDLCAAPGSWSQVLADRLYNAGGHDNKDDNNNNNAEPQRQGMAEIEADAPRIVAVDLQPMAPVQGVVTLQGDITNLDTARQIISLLQGQRAELVVCDGAPDVTGLHDVDEYLQGQLLLAAALITTHVLEQSGTFVAKMFRGPNTVRFLQDQLRLLFERVSISKPSSSRNSSMESFVVCQQFKGGRCLNLPLDLGGYVDLQDVMGLPKNDDEQDNTAKEDDLFRQAVLPFVACGDLSGWSSNGDVLDADKSSAAEQYKAPLVPPTQPPFQTSKEILQQERR